MVQSRDWTRQWRRRIAAIPPNETCWRQAKCKSRYGINQRKMRRRRGGPFTINTQLFLPFLFRNILPIKQWPCSSSFFSARSNRCGQVCAKSRFQIPVGLGDCAKKLIRMGEWGRREKALRIIVRPRTNGICFAGAFAVAFLRWKGRGLGYRVAFKEITT